jgi:hypothetical protein
LRIHVSYPCLMELIKETGNNSWLIDNLVYWRY